MKADLCDLESRTHNDVEVSFDVDSQFKGLMIVPENLSPRPNTGAEASQMLEQFADLAVYKPPVRDDFRWLFRPDAT